MADKTQIEALRLAEHYRNAIATACEGWSMADGLRKHLESALWNPPAHKDDGFYEAVNDMDGLYQAAPSAALGEPDPADIIAGALQTSRGHAIEMMRKALEAAPQQEPFGWIKSSEVESSNRFGGSINLWRVKYDCDIPIFTAPQPAPGELHDYQILAITTAYEQGVGKGHQAHKTGKEIANPYGTGYRCDLAWQYGYEEGKKQAERLVDRPGLGSEEPIAWESTVPGYIKYVTQSKYEKFSTKVQRWYKPYKCSSCAMPPATWPSEALVWEALQAYLKHDTNMEGMRAALIVGASSRGLEDSELLKPAARNLKYFIEHAQFSSFADKRAALNCLDALAAPQPAPAPQPASATQQAVVFDAQGYRDWVYRNLPDETLVGNGAWWADHLTAWAKRFVKVAPQPAPLSDDVVKDAMRYAALRDGTLCHDDVLKVVKDPGRWERPYVILRRGSELDSAIDAALAARESKT